MATREELEAHARSFAKEFGVDPDIYVRQINQESGWNPRAVSNKGAQGIAQFMPDTAKAMGLTDPFDPIASLRAGAQLMKENLATFGGDYEKALGAYNTGPKNIKKGVWPDETVTYVERILGRRPTRGELGLRTFLPSRPTREGLGLRTLTPNPWAGRYQAALGEIRSAEEGLNEVAGSPLNLPRTPVPQEMGAGELGIGGLFGSIASAISGNPLYQQSFMAQRMGREQERAGAQAENLQIERQEILQRRAENLQMTAKRQELAFRRLEEAGKYEAAMQMAREHDQTLERLQKMQDASKQDEIDQRREEAFLRAGYRINAQTGLPEQGGVTPVKFARKDRQAALAEFIKLRNTKDISGEMRTATEAGIRNMIFTRDEEDSTWKEYSQRVIAEARLNNVPPEEIMPLLIAKALEYSEEMPGADDAYKLATAPPPAQSEAEPAEDIDRAAAQAQAGMKPTKASAGRQPVGWELGGIGGGEGPKTPEEVQQARIAEAEKQIANLEKMVTSGGVPPELLAGVYREMEKKRVDLETIKRKGRPPEKKR